MKKFFKTGTKIAALLASVFLLFGTVACSGDDDDNDSGNNTGGGGNTTVAVTGIAVSPSSAKLAVGSTDKASTKLTATVSPSNATNTNVTWSFAVAGAEDADAWKNYLSLGTGETLSSSEINLTVSLADGISIDDKVEITATATAEGDTSKKASATIKIYASDTDLKNDSGITLTKNSEEAVKYATIKAALEAIPSEATASDTYTITLEPDTYEEDALSYSGNANITIEGNSTATYGAGVIIKGKGSSQTNSTSRCLLYIGGTANVTLKNITLQNIIKRAEVTETDKDGNKLTQAEALGFNSTGKLIAYNSAFKSHQDTIRTVGKAWFYKCYVEGDVDFIWMEQSGVVALYEDCEIVMLGDDEKTEGYVLAPRTTVGTKIAKGNVIYGGKITIDSKVTKGYLFRNPWGSNTSYYNQGAVIDTTIIANGTLNASLASSAAMGTEDQQFIGWKVDSKIANNYTGKLSSIGVVSDRYKNREYNGRYVILNRVYNIKEQKFENASELWDAAKDLTATGVDESAIADDASKNKIFLDYADVTKTSIGDELVVTNFDGEVTNDITWEVEAYSDAELKTEVSNGVTIANGVTTKTENAGNIYVKVTATVGGVSDYLTQYSLTATGISIEKEVTIGKGSTYQLTPTFEPAEATAEVEWSSDSDSKGVTVEDGLVTVTSDATATSAVITAKIKDSSPEIKATCTVTITESAKLYYIGTGTEPTIENGAVTGLTTTNTYMIYDQDLLDSSVTSAVFEGTFSWSASDGTYAGFGLVALKDGAWASVTAADNYELVGPQGIKGISSTQLADASGSNIQVKYDSTAYTGKVTYKKSEDDYSFTLEALNADGTVYGSKTLSKSNFSALSGYERLYFAVGGAGAANATYKDIKVSINGSAASTCAEVDTLPTDNRTPLTASGGAAYELTTTDYSSYAGTSDSIPLSKVSLNGLSVSPSAATGTWIWDSSSVTTTGKNVTATATFIPTDRSTYKALLSHTVTISVTDSRTVSDKTIATVTYFGQSMTSGNLLVGIIENDKNSVLTQTNAVATGLTSLTYKEDAGYEGSTEKTGTKYCQYSIPKAAGTSASADYNIQFAVKNSGSSAITLSAISAKTTNKGGTGNFTTDLWYSTDGTNFTKAASVKGKQVDITTASDFSVSIAAGTTLYVQARPYLDSADAKNESICDVVITFEY